MTPTKIEISLGDKQYPFVFSSSRFSAFVAGIGAGKTRAGVVRALLASQGQIGGKPIRTPNLGIITAPTYPMLKDATLRTFFDVAGNVGDGIIVSHNKSDNVVRLANGSEILFRSTDNPERLRGSNASWWFGDEAALYEPSVWNIMIGRLRQFGVAGSAWITTTPKGKNWIYQKFVARASTNYQLFRSKTTENLFLQREFIAALVESYSGEFAAQELDAEFVAFEGLVYPEFTTQLHTKLPHPSAQLTYYGGADYGYTNPGVVLIAGVDGDGRAYIIHEEYQRQRKQEEWVTIIKDLHAKHNLVSLWVDPSAPDYITAIYNEGVPAEPANNAVSTGIQAVRSYLTIKSDNQPRLFFSPSCANTVKEFEQYQWAGDKHGFIDRPAKQSDHAMDALRYLIMGIKEQASNVANTSTSSYI